MRDTTFPIYDENFSHHDAHAYANDKRLAGLIMIGFVLSAVVLAAFLAVLAAHTPR
jgi:hypothetical protein